MMKAAVRATVLALAMLVVACATARACEPPARLVARPTVYSLIPDAQLVTSMSLTRRTMSPDHVYIQLALMRVPPGSTWRMPICGGSPLVSQPASGGAIEEPTAKDLARVRALLVGAGVSGSAIQTGLTAAPRNDRDGSVATHAAIGQVLVDVRPLSNRQFGSIVRRIDKVLDAVDAGKDPSNRGLWLRSADFVVTRNSCGEVARSKSDADREAFWAARRFGASIGLRIVDDIDTDRTPLVGVGDDHAVDGIESIVSPQYLCGDAPVTMPYWKQMNPSFEGLASGSDPMVVPRWVTGYREAGVFRAVGAPSIAPVGVPGALDLSAAPREENALGTVARAVQVGLQVPFVSAHGAFRATVRADALLVVFTHRYPIDPATPMTSVVTALLAAGVAPRDILLRHDREDAELAEGGRDASLLRPDDWVFVRVFPVTSEELSRVVNAAPSPTTIESFVAPFVADCSSRRTAVTRNAMHDAFERARTMATAAATALDGFIGVADAGFGTDAACGLGSTAAVATLAHAARATVGGSDDVFRRYRSERDGVDVEFSSEVVGAWRLSGRASSVTGSLPVKREAGRGYGNAQDAFLSALPGILADASRPLTAIQPALKCQADQLAALADAVRIAMKKIAGRQPRVIIDSAQGYVDPGGLCGLDRGRYEASTDTNSFPYVEFARDSPPTVREQVEIVP